MLRGCWLIPALCPSNPSFSSLGSTSIVYCRQHLDSSNNTEGSSHIVSLSPRHVLGEWAIDGAIGPPEVELTLALPLGEDQQVGCAPCVSTLLPLTQICNQDESNLILGFFLSGYRILHEARGSNRS